MQLLVTMWLSTFNEYCRMFWKVRAKSSQTPVIGFTKSTLRRTDSRGSLIWDRDIVQTPLKVIRHCYPGAASSKRLSCTTCTRNFATEKFAPSFSQTNVYLKIPLYSCRYNAAPHREGRFVDENSFGPLQTTPTLLTHAYNKVDFNQRSEENNERSMSSRVSVNRQFY